MSANCNPAIDMEHRNQPFYNQVNSGGGTTLVLARDGIAPSPPAFSGLPSNYAKRFGINACD
jgi:hypothetical protein